MEAFARGIFDLKGLLIYGFFPCKLESQKNAPNLPVYS